MVVAQAPGWPTAPLAPPPDSPMSVMRHALAMERGLLISETPRDASPSSVTFVLDRGSNAVLFASDVLRRRGTVVSDVAEVVRGAWKGAVAHVGRQVRVRLRFGPLVVELEGGDAPDSRRDILSESVLWDTLSWTVLGEPYMHIETPCGAKLPIVRVDGLYFVTAEVL